MTEGLDKKQAKILTFLIIFLLTFLTFLSSWSKYESHQNTRKFQDLPNEYVRLERYRCDQDRLYKAIEKMNDKLDRLIERQGP